MRERTDPVAGENGDEHHPAFGMISVHRISSNPGGVMFQSNLPHPEFIRIAVHEASRKRDLKHDWVHPEKMVCEVSMSMAQFASFVSSGGTTGVPCTIEWTGSGSQEPGSRPALRLAPRLQLTADEVRAAAEDAYGNIREALKAYEDTLAGTGPGSTAAKKAAFRNLRSSIANAVSNVAYATQQLDRHAEEVVESSRADIEAMMTRMAERLGIPQNSIQAIEQGEH